MTTTKPVVPLPLDPEQVLTQHNRMLYQLAWQCWRRLPRQSLYTVEDLHQEAAARMLYALKLYQPERGVKFFTYAYWSVARGLLKIQRREWKRRLPTCSLWSRKTNAPREIPVAPGQLAIELGVDLTRLP